MLKKENSIKKNADFQRIYKKGEFFATKPLHFKYMKNKISFTRIGFVIGLKVSKSAVKRNQLKRRMRAIFNLILDKIKPGYDIAVIVKPGAIELDYKEIEKNILFFLKKASLL